MNAVIEQAEFDFAGETLETVFNLRAQSEAKNWTEEALCLQWLCSQNSPDWDWWRGLKSYERNAWLADYRCGRELVEQGLRMPSPDLIIARHNERYAETVALAKSWASEVRQAFKDGTPCPIKPEPAFKLALDMAIDLAGIPAECIK